MPGGGRLVGAAAGGEKDSTWALRKNSGEEDRRRSKRDGSTVFWTSKPFIHYLAVVRGLATGREERLTLPAKSPAQPDAHFSKREPVTLDGIVVRPWPPVSWEPASSCSYRSDASAAFLALVPDGVSDASDANACIIDIACRSAGAVIADVGEADISST